MTLNFESPNNHSKKKSKTKYKAALGVGSAVSLLGIGSTLAANITLSGDNSVEFGQGVVTTAACDEDGFTITPITYFDNEHSIFRVSRVEVSGVNLTPEGTGWELASNPTYVDQAAAKLARPGQYYTGTAWKKTCDGVVLDFKAYTSDPEYALYTDDAYSNPSNTSITSPLGWTQRFYSGTSNIDYAVNPGFAVVIDPDDGGVTDFDSGYSYNFAFNGVDKSYPHGFPGDVLLNLANSTTWSTSNASFNFRSRYSDERPNAASISKITVQSMDEFPDSYYAITKYNPTWRTNLNVDLGNPSGGWY
jgi:hypothetical protein